MQIHDAVLEALEDDVAAILGNRRADAGIEQFLDLGDDLVVILLDRCVVAISSITGRSAVKWSMMTPRICGFSTGQSVAVGLGDGDEIAAQEDARHTVIEQRQRRAGGPVGGGEIGGARPMTSRPGRNFSVAGLGVCSV